MRISRRALQRILWALLLVTAPVPFYLGALELAPALRLFFLAALTFGVAATEGTAGHIASFTALAAVQSLLWAALLYGLAALAARGIARLAEGRARLALLAALLVGAFGLSSLEIYRTPLSSRAPQSNLAGLFD